MKKSYKNINNISPGIFNINNKNNRLKFLFTVFLIISLIYSFSCASCMLTVSAEKETASTVFVNEKAKIDFTDSDETGTVKVNVVSKVDIRVKVMITKNDDKWTDIETYTYDLKNDTTIESYPLQMGDGKYTVKVFLQIEGIKYKSVLAGRYILKLSDVKAPFLNPNQYVNYSKDSKIVQKAYELTKHCVTELEKVEAIYKFVINNIEYDTHKASTVQSGYLPSVDEILESGKGICFDYAVIFAAMLRSQNIPAKLVMGYTKPNDVYHAWNEFYLKDEGGRFKINDMKFNGKIFERVDPTFDSSSKSSKKVLQFIGDGTNYMKLYEY